MLDTIFIVLLILKLCGLITISWGWVLLPLVLSFLFGVFLAAIRDA